MAEISLVNSNVPIVGQPKIGDWYFTLVVECSCKRTVLFVGRVGSIAECPTCKKLYKLNGLPVIGEGNTIIVPLAVGVNRLSEVEAPRD